MQFFSKKNTITHFSADMKSVYTIEPGETVVVETHDCYGGQIADESVLRPDIDLSIMNQATGPFYVNGVKAGDILVVEILDIELDPSGVMVMSKGLGVLGDLVDEPSTKIVPVKDGRILFGDGLIFPVAPMIGVIGVAPRKGSVHCAVPGDHGGNMDTKDIRAGSRIYFPVFQEGGLFALGDLHASMGDGEMNGTGVEIGGKVKMKVDKREGCLLSVPVVETKDAFMFISSAETLEAAVQRGAGIVVEHLQNALALEFGEAYRLLTMLCDVKISQVVNKLVTIRVEVPKSLLFKLFG
ncbi:MAG TPA: acetamidase [Bacillus bacterium]|uniref:Formamidase n=1 Tax=Siminovitchia fordii TaxID=254759 RepID=A0ABQ4K917_9BACI|nr:acetamidase/formamidase family protein [Siminovitchia fordii]GIN22214.1 formamidase [Siminovitchia fordii]HBZ08934.1 acetamidase [Bacillus sp. (in: firmicutes)]